MIFDNDSIVRLRSLVKARLSEKRFIHTLGVEKLAVQLAEVLLPEKVSELSVAALLHDVAKELSYEEHIALLKGSDVKYTEEDLSIKPALHSIAALPLISEFFKEYATPDVRSAVANHTLGAPDMSVFDEIIFISDYAEEGRTYRTCIEVRNYLLDNVRKENSVAENIRSLHIASLKSIESTVESLTKRNEKINSRTLMTKSYLDKIIVK
jgi:predicted HD superfamily hydrolase involved in NAD metabolism